MNAGCPTDWRWYFQWCKRYIHKKSNHSCFCGRYSRELPQFVHTIKYHHKFDSDLKLGNIVLGLMECGARHGCPHCEGKKNTCGEWEKGDPRDLEDLTSDHTMWAENSGKKNELKEFFIVQHVPLLQTPTAKLVHSCQYQVSNGDSPCH